ncbi:MAG TPA: ATP synthase F1 subunit delta [Candidatus Binatia bacterium]|nr:ATP synthase F1 subunit delta [Candidatus Binatia bacterium]
MKLTAQQYARTLFETLQDTADKDHDKVLDNFIEALAINNDTSLFEEIMSEFEKLDKAKKGIKVAEVISAKPLTPHTEKEIVEHLNKMVNGKVELKKKIDENLLGGVVIKMDDTLIDGSVKKSLEELKQDLTD